MKKVISCLPVLLLAATLMGQYDPRENFYDAEFFFAEEDYEEALFSFKKVYDDGYQDNANINYRIGVCLLSIDGKKTEAIPYLEKAVQNINLRYKLGNFKEKGAPPDAWLYLGNAYRINYDNEKAYDSYNKYIETFPDPDDMENHQLMYAKLQIDACKLSSKAISDPIEYDEGTLGQLNEISAPVYNAVLSGDLNTLAFMGKHKFYNGIYVSRKIDGKWMKPINITPDIQSDGNQDVVSLSYDGKQMLLAWSDEFDSEIWIAKYSDERWHKSEPIGKPINSKYFESHAAFAPDGNTIYFTSNSKEAVGEMDIFKSVKNSDGTWGEIQNLGETINSPLNEDVPYVSPDGKRLYFSSQGHASLGGYDIYFSEIKEDGSYGEPVNLGYPLNTGDDDFAIMPKQVKKKGYMTLYAKGDDEQVDFFNFEWIPESAEPMIVAFQEEEAEEVAEVAEEVVEETVEEVVPETYLVKPVFFDFDSDKISTTAAAKLDDLAMILGKFPGVELEIHGHTDAVGSIEYNQQLSERRAKAVSNYLQSKDIAKNRMILKGESEREPVAINRTSENKDAPEGRQLNRRVEFAVKVAGGVLIEIEEVEVPDYLIIK